MACQQAALARSTAAADLDVPRLKSRLRSRAAVVAATPEGRLTVPLCPRRGARARKQPRGGAGCGGRVVVAAGDRRRSAPTSVRPRDSRGGGGHRGGGSAKQEAKQQWKG
jgi:hypothetical protein